ncbi:hypothetical protein PAPYR_10511 [Paratrimastix pyriformis]|uniref:Uncharacterized protein n=1 Tax=Paratrimastix pyriformis TaxID=342808 RepID=A0ABQ8UBK4_9EUKA|nr:hypothetical protein PAPYR_10511 [Paratrimastix pyriformis]
MNSRTNDTYMSGRNGSKVHIPNRFDISDNDVLTELTCTSQLAFLGNIASCSIKRQPDDITHTSYCGSCGRRTDLRKFPELSNVFYLIAQSFTESFHRGPPFAVIHLPMALRFTQNFTPGSLVVAVRHKKKENERGPPERNPWPDRPVDVGNTQRGVLEASGRPLGKRRLGRLPDRRAVGVLAQIAAALRENDAYEVLMKIFTVDQLSPFAVAKGLKVPKRKADLVTSLIRNARPD